MFNVTVIAFKSTLLAIVLASVAVLFTGCGHVSATRGINTNSEAATAARAKALATATSISTQQVVFRKSQR